MKSILKILLLTGLFILRFQPLLSQSVALSPTSPNPNNLTFTTPVNAGLGVANINNTSQKVNYAGKSISTSIDVSLFVGSIPPGMRITESVPAGSWLQELLGGYGISQGEVTIGTTPKSILTAIWQTSASNRVVTLSVDVLNFSELRANTYPIQLLYTITP